jgi:hypothetical protein
MAIANPNHIIAEQDENGEMVERPMTAEEVENYEQIASTAIAL